MSSLQSSKVGEKPKKGIVHNFVQVNNVLCLYSVFLVSKSISLKCLVFILALHIFCTQLKRVKLFCCAHVSNTQNSSQLF